MTFAEKMKCNRKLAGMTQAELADRLGVSRQLVASYEGGAKHPKLETVIRIAEALGVHPEQLWGDEQAPLLAFKDAVDRGDGEGIAEALGLPSGTVQWVGKIATVKEAELVIAFRALPADKQDMVLAIAKGLR